MSREGANETKKNKGTKRREKREGKSRMKRPLLTRNDPHTFAQLFWGSISLGNQQPLWKNPSVQPKAKPLCGEEREWGGGKDGRDSERGWEGEKKTEVWMGGQTPSLPTKGLLLLGWHSMQERKKKILLVLIATRNYMCSKCYSGKSWVMFEESFACVILCYFVIIWNLLMHKKVLNVAPSPVAQWRISSMHFIIKFRLLIAFWGFYRKQLCNWK